METKIEQGYSAPVIEFRRDYLNRVLIFLASLIWLIGSVILLLKTSPEIVLFIFSFEIALIFIYYLGRRTMMALAETTLAASSLVLAVILIYWLRDPLLLILLVLAVSVDTTLFHTRWITILTALVVALELYITHALFVAVWSGWQVLIIPLATIIVAVVGRIREYNFESVLAWSATSTRAAIAHMEEAREHRAKLFRSVKDLNDAYHRLERANQMLLEARAEAEEARRTQKQFALTISHELRTPLSFIIGFSEVMVNSPQVYGNLDTWPAGLYEDIQDIYRSSQHLLTLVNDVLDLGKVDANRLLLVKEVLAPGLMVKEAQAIMHEAVAAKGLWFDLDCPPNLPDIYIDRTRIRQVLINLINNSLRFTEQGGITISVCVQEQNILFSVKDTGCGIPENEMDKVFEEFGQASSTVWRKREGSGLGMPISQRFVEMHGGRIWLESTPGQGTTFFFTIPLPGTVNWPRWLAEPASNEYWKFQEKENQCAPMLLVLSPDPGSSRVIESILEGYQVSAALDTADAAQQIAQFLPQALIIDRALQDGPEVARLTQNLPYDLPMFTFAIPGSMSTFHKLPEGVVDYLPKPFLRENLCAAIQRLESPVSRLWIIDDDEAMVRFIRLAFLSSNAEAAPRILAAGSGADAIQQLEALMQASDMESLPEAFLLDLGLPDMTGWDLLPRLRELFLTRGLPPPPVILITAAVLSEELEARKRKVIEISTLHPLSSQKLGAVLHSLLQHVRPQFSAGQNEPALTEIPVEKSAS